MNTSGKVQDGELRFLKKNGWRRQKAGRGEVDGLPTWRKTLDYLLDEFGVPLMYKVARNAHTRRGCDWTAYQCGRNGCPRGGQDVAILSMVEFQIYEDYIRDEKRKITKAAMNIERAERGFLNRRRKKVKE